MNHQTPEQPVKSERGVLEVHSIFYTIQGEGPYAGTPAVFLRLSGCNLQCPSCDTEYTLSRKRMEPGEIVFQICKLLTDANRIWKNHLVVITGGEPFRQNLGPFIALALDACLRIQIETNGTLFCETVPFDYHHDRLMIVCSPKTGRINAQLAWHVHAFKYVVQDGFVDERTGLPTRTLGNQNQILVAPPPAGSNARIFIQPLDEMDTAKNAANMRAAVKSCLTFGHSLCIQTHKIANLP